MYEAFVINLDRHPGRLRFMEAQFAALGLSFTRIRGVNGYDPAEIADAAAAPYAALSNGEIGCFESHKAAWQQIVDRKLPAAYVFEDDVAIASDFGRIEMPDGLLEGADIVKMDHHPVASRCGTAESPIGAGRVLRRLIGSENSASCYLVTGRGAKKLLAASRGYYLPLDLYIFNEISKVSRDLVIWKLFPAASAQLKFLDGAEALPDEVAEGIQARRRSDSDPRPAEAGRRKARLRLRRLLELDVKPVRRHWISRRLRRFEAQEATAFGVSPFHTETRMHISQGARAMERPL